MTNFTSRQPKDLADQRTYTIYNTGQNIAYSMLQK
jgi:hypothetical protein